MRQGNFTVGMMREPVSTSPLLRAGSWIAGAPRTVAQKSARIFADQKTKGTASAVPFVYRDHMPRRFTRPYKAGICR